MLDARIASALNKIIQNSHFKKVSLEEQKAQKEDRFLRGRQIAYMIYDYFQVTGAHDTVLDYADLFSITLRDDDVQDFDTRWDEILLSMTKIPPDDILESLNQLRILESDQLTTVLELFDMENHQKISMPNNQKLKTMVKRSKDQKLRLRTFDARSERIETGAVVTSRRRSSGIERGQGVFYKWKAKGQCSRGDRCSFRHDNHERVKPTPKTAPSSEPPTPRGRSASRKRNFRGRSPSEKTNRQPYRDFIKFTCSGLFCANWHPPDVCGVGLAKQPDIPLQWAEEQGSNLVFSNEVVGAEGRDRQQVGDEAIRGKRVTGTPFQGHYEEMTMFLRNSRHSSLVLWANADVTTLEECGSMSELCIVMFSREKCASARVQLGVVSTPPSRSWQLLLSGREAARFSNFCRRANGTKLNMQSELTGWHWQGGISRLRMLFRAAIGAWVRCCRISPLVWPFVVLPFLRVPFLPTFESMKTNSTMLGLGWPVWRMMVVGDNRCRSPRCHSLASLIPLTHSAAEWEALTTLAIVRDAHVWSAPCIVAATFGSSLPLAWPTFGLDCACHHTSREWVLTNASCLWSLEASQVLLAAIGIFWSIGSKPDLSAFPFHHVRSSSSRQHRSKCSRNSFASAQKNVNSTPSAHTFSHADSSLRLLSEFLVQL